VSKLSIAFGEVQLLLDLAGMEGGSFNEVLKGTGGLNAMQMVALRCLLHVLR